MKISIVRGAFLNPFELQNYSSLRRSFEISVYSSKHPISSNIDLPLEKLWSPTDLPNFPYKYPVLNRIFVDAHRLFGLEKMIKGSDIVHVAETYYGYTYQAVVAKRRGMVRRVVSTVWEIIPFSNESIKGRKQYKRMAYENIDHFIAVTEKAKQALIKEGVSPAKISVVNMGIDLKKFKPNLSAKKTKKVNILCVARLVPEKGVGDLLKAFLSLKENNQKINLTFVGSGPLKSELVGFKNVFVKSIPYHQIQKEYQKADIFCLPSRETKTWKEQYGMCLLEAMACGLPIVTTNSGAIPEVCGDVALISRHSDINELKTNLEKLIYNVNLRQSLSIASRQRAEERFNCQKTAKKIKKIYEEISCH
jgi:glycosyltransferase involved in cell wall biosynthesis